MSRVQWEYNSPYIEFSKEPNNERSKECLHET